MHHVQTAAVELPCHAGALLMSISLLFALWCTVVAWTEHCSIPCDWSVSNPWWVEVAVTSSHLVRVLGFWNAGHEWLCFIAIDWLIAGLLVTLQLDVSRQLVDVEVLLAVV